MTDKALEKKFVNVFTTPNIPDPNHPLTDAQRHEWAESNAYIKEKVKPEITFDASGRPKGCGVPRGMNPFSSPIDECMAKVDAMRVEIQQQEFTAIRQYRESDFYKEKEMIAQQSSEIRGIISRAKSNIQKALQVNLCPFIRQLSDKLANDTSLDYASVDVVLMTPKFLDRLVPDALGIAIELNLDRYSRVYIGGGVEVDVLKVIPATRLAAPMINSAASEAFGNVNPASLIARAIPKADGVTVTGSKFLSDDRENKKTGKVLKKDEYAKAFLSGVEVNAGITVFSVFFGITRPIFTDIDAWSFDMGNDSDFIGAGVGTNYSIEVTTHFGGC